MDITDQIREVIAENRIILFMKGSPDAPQCGYSAHTVEALKALGAEFAYVDVLQYPEVRQALPRVSEWPTFPQLFVDGELVGGCDIVLELYHSGELEQLVRGTEASASGAD